MEQQRQLSRKPVSYKEVNIHGQLVKVAVYSPKWAVDPGYMHDGVGRSDPLASPKFDPFQAEWAYSKGAKTV